MAILYYKNETGNETGIESRARRYADKAVEPDAAFHEDIENGGGERFSAVYDAFDDAGWLHDVRESDDVWGHGVSARADVLLFGVSVRAVERVLCRRGGRLSPFRKESRRRE